MKNSMRHATTEYLVGPPGGTVYLAVPSARRKSQAATMAGGVAVVLLASLVIMALALLLLYSWFLIGAGWQLTSGG